MFTGLKGYTVNANERRFNRSPGPPSEEGTVESLFAGNWMLRSVVPDPSARSPGKLRGAGFGLILMRGKYA